MSEGFGFEGDTYPMSETQHDQECRYSDKADCICKPVAPAPTASATNCPYSRRISSNICGTSFAVHGVGHACQLNPDHDGAHECNCPSQSSKLEGVGQEAAEKRCCENGYFGETHDCMKQSAQSAEVERLSKRIEALQAIIRKGYASFDLQQIRKSLVAIEGMALYFYDDPSETKRSEYLSEALRCRLMIKDYGKDENLDLAARAEAAESKLSQLQLANEEKARKIADLIDSSVNGCYYVSGVPLTREGFVKKVVAILNGGQQ